MKVLYSKFTRERVPAFQQETTIFLDDTGRKKVRKRALKEAGQKHMQDMYENYIRFKEKGCTCFLECEKEESGICFPFIEGESLYEKMVAEVRKRNKEGFMEILQQYEEIIGQCVYKRESFQEDEKFRKIFGDGSELTGMEASRYFDVDLTFDNIITDRNGCVRIIDYEWMFDCLVPVKFAVYRAMFAFYLKHGGQLAGIITEDEYYQYAGIDRKMRNLFAKMNACMMDYIMGKEDIKQQYQKSVRMFSEMSREEVFFSQVFIGTREGYSEAASFLYPIKHKEFHKRIVLNLEKYKDLQSLRIDPLNTACAVQLGEICLKTEKGSRVIRNNEILTNAEEAYNGFFEFTGEDPQMILMNDRDEQWKSITIDFDILHYKNNRGNIIVSENQMSDKMKEIQRQKEHIHLLQAKIAYIENLKIYGLLLKDKVDKAKDWEMPDA